MKATVHLLNHASAHPDAEIICRASNMIPHVNGNAACPVALEAQSCAGGCRHLSNNDGKTSNRPVLALAKVIKNIMASAAIAELGALCLSGQEVVALRNGLEAMGCHQLAALMKTDDSTANGVVNDAMKQKRSKAIDMRFCWPRNRSDQNQFRICWEAGKTNFGDFHTKHHPAVCHKAMQPIHTHTEGPSPESLQGCVEMMTKTDLVKSPTLMKQQPQQEEQGE